MSESSLVELLVARNGLESLGTYKMNYTRMVHSLTLKGVNIIILCIILLSDNKTVLISHLMPMNR